MPRVLYFHGFASSPASAKITVLRPLLAPHGVELVTPDLNAPSFERLDWNAIVERGVAVARDTQPAAIVGSSLGALVAIAVAKHGIHVPLVLIAPALGIAQRWKKAIPAGDPVTVFNYARNESMAIHRAFFDQIEELYIDADPPPAPVTIVMGRRDETVPYTLVRETWDRWRLGPPSRFIEIEKGDHGLVMHTDTIAGAILEAVR